MLFVERLNSQPATYDEVLGLRCYPDLVSIQLRERGSDVLLDVDVQGAEQVRRACPDAVTIFVLAPSFDVLERRLKDRSSDKPENIEMRLKAARREVDRFKDYDYLIVNDDADRSAELLRSIVLAERARPSMMEAQIRPIVDSFK